jgi:hypothetical protein
MSILAVQKSFEEDSAMFFIMGGGKVYHKLDDAEDGRAPCPCGARLDRHSRWMLKQGKRTPSIFEQVPADGQLCKKCEVAESGNV